MALNAQVNLSLLAHETSSGDLSSTLRATPASYALLLSDGTGAGQAQVAWSDSRTATDNTDSLNLQSLPDDRGTVSFSAIKAFYVANKGTKALFISGEWTTGPNSNPDESYLVVVPGGVAFFSAPTAAGYSVSSVSRLLSFISEDGTAVPYDVILVGEGSVS